MASQRGLYPRLAGQISRHPQYPHRSPRPRPIHTAAAAPDVANHISWIDIWAIKQAFPVNFVAKSEVRDWPVIGWLAQRVGTLFIERARRHDTGRTASSMEEGLRQNACLCLFPEGTTTDGTELKPFKTGLLQSAINTESTVWPVALRYPRADGGINTAIAYDGDTTLLESMLAVLKQREIFTTATRKRVSALVITRNRLMPDKVSSQ